MKYNIRVINHKESKSIIMVDDSPAKITKNKAGFYEINGETDNPTVKLSLYEYSPILSPLWILFEIFYFIISLFGLFDNYRNLKGRAVKLNAELSLSEGDNNYILRVLKWRKDQPAVKLERKDGGENVEETETGVQDVVETDNLCFIDQTIVKRNKILIGVKIAVAVVIVTLLAFLIF